MSTEIVFHNIPTTDLINGKLHRILYFIEPGSSELFEVYEDFRHERFLNVKLCHYQDDDDFDHYYFSLHFEEEFLLGSRLSGHEEFSHYIRNFSRFYKQ